ncbi:hypothetical protein H4R18_003752 [Coemansia javaensis]|uniref:HOOK N-terminal domain-containing protein n=1 Tax=Coemansia javaensis TaxID=2761396 RepID=A0A9W8LFV0_9FUNG|nr:hypothetical protein H4R18_003752 [Coemansia javaensis]
MSQEDIARGFVNWVGTFGSLSKPVASLGDLTDGIALFEICAEVDRQWFKSIRSADIGDNWVLKLNNLKKLYKLVTRYYEEVLGYPASSLAEPSLPAIAKSEDPGELLKLCQLVLTLAVQCENNSVYIGKITTLNEDDQRCLMVSIESVLAQLGDADPEEDPDGQDVDMMDAALGGAADGADPVARLQAELMRSYAEKDVLEKSALELTAEHRQIQTKYEDLLVLNEELKARMEDLEKSMARADKSGKADFLLRAEIDNLKHQLEKADMRNQHAEHASSEQQATIADLTRRLAEASEAAEEAARLRDELQEYKHAADRLVKSEHVIDKYKKKFEESADLRRQVRQLEEQLAQAQDRAQQIEDEYRRVSQLRPTMDSYRDEYTQLEGRHALVVAELSQAAERLRALEAEKERLVQDRQRDQEQISALEESLRELELGAASGAATQAGGATLESGLASAADADSRPALLAKVARLERELSEAQRARSQAPSTDAAGFLEEVADAATREKTQALEELERERELRRRLEAAAVERADELRGAKQASDDAARLRDDLARTTERLVQATGEAAGLQSELAQAREELARARAASLASEQEASLAREALRRFDGSEVASLRRETQSLEDWYAETHEQGKAFKAEVDRLSAENRQLAQHMSRLQGELTQLDIGRRDAEAECRRMQQALERQRAEQASSSHYSQADVDRLQKELISSRDEVHSLQIALKRTKNQCIKLGSMLEQAGVVGGGSGSGGGAAPQDDYKEVLVSLQSQLALKDEQLDSMRAMLREQNNVHLLESRTMVSAWFNLQRQLERQSGFGHSSGMGSAAATARPSGTPASWLGQQRITLDMQLSG